MSTLTWAIYLSDVASSMSQVCAFFGGACVVITVVGSIIYAVCSLDGDKPPEFTPMLLKAWRLGLPLILFAVLMPSSATTRAMIASEIGARVAASPSGQEVGEEAKKALLSWLRSIQSQDKKADAP